MNELLTPQEVLQALIDGKKIEVRSEIHDVWWEFDPRRFCVDTLLNEEVKFRMPQETITVGDVSFPKPYHGEMLYKQEYYYPIMDYASLFGSNTWENDRADLFLMKKGLVHLTKENAIAHAKALIKLSGGEICQS